MCDSGSWSSSCLRDFYAPPFNSSVRIRECMRLLKEVPIPGTPRDAQTRYRTASRLCSGLARAARTGHAAVGHTARPATAAAPACTESFRPTPHSQARESHACMHDSSSCTLAVSPHGRRLHLQKSSDALDPGDVGAHDTCWALQHLVLPSQLLELGLGRELSAELLLQ